MQLTIASYNIHSGVGTDGRFDLWRTASVLEEIGPDIVALQECGDLHGRNGDEQHPEVLARILSMHMAFGPNVVRAGRRYGNAILSRLSILKSKNYDLSFKRREPRGALRCDLDLGQGRSLHVFSLHLGLWRQERRAQEQRLLLSADLLRDAARVDPLIVCGDFNYWWSGPVPALVRHSIHDAAIALGRVQRTFPSRLPLLRLDRIFVDDGIRPLSIWVHRSKLAEMASDHLPVVMRFEPLLRSRPAPHPVELIA